MFTDRLTAKYEGERQSSAVPPRNIIEPTLTRITTDGSAAPRRAPHTAELSSLTNTQPLSPDGSIADRPVRLGGAALFYLSPGEYRHDHL